MTPLNYCKKVVYNFVFQSLFFSQINIKFSSPYN
jgi:hypothetical protein